MKITGITLWQVPLESHVAYLMAAGKKCDTVTSVVLRIDTDGGLSGWGEVCPIPHYLPAYADGVEPTVRHLAPLLLGADPRGPEAIGAKLDAHLPGHVYAKSPIDIALWDLTARAAGLPLHTLLGGRRSERLPLYHSITCVAPDEMVRMALEAQGQGIKQFQVKLGADDNWLADVERLIKVREAVGTGPLVYGDWNCGATQLDATRVGRAVEHLDIMLEQPCRSIKECHAVRQATGLPMKLDENVHDTATLLMAHELGCLDAAALKLSKFGGLSALRRARDLCEHMGVKMCIEDTWGSDIAMAAALHLAASTDPQCVLNVCDLSGYVAPRLAPQGPTRADGMIEISDTPGLGIEIDETVLGTPMATFG